MKNRFQIFTLALLITNTLYSYNNQYGNYHSFDTPQFSYSVKNLITYIIKEDTKNSNKYKDISTISNIISGMLNEIWISTANTNKNTIHSNNAENIKSLLYRKLNLQLNNKLKNFKFNVSYIGRNNITISFTHTVKIENSNSSDYTLYFIFKNNKLFCKIVNSDIYKVTVLKYNFQNNNFEKLKGKQVPTKLMHNTNSLKNSPNIPSNFELYNTIFRVLDASRIINNRDIITKSSRHIANKIHDVIQVLQQQNNMPEQNKNIQKTIWEILKNPELENIEIYDYSTDTNNINICFSINRVYQISLVVCNNNITLVCWNITNGTMTMFMFYKEKQKFLTISLNELEKINLIPSENSVKELISNVMNTKKIPHEYINNYIISVPVMLNCVKISLSTNNSTKTDNASTEILDLKNLKQALLKKNIELNINSQQINDSKVTTFCFFIKDIFSTKFIVTEDSSKSSLELCLSKLLPSNTYKFDPQSQKFTEKLDKNNNSSF